MLLCSNSKPPCFPYFWKFFTNFKFFNFAAFNPNILLFAPCTCLTLSHSCVFAYHSPNHFGITPPTPFYIIMSSRSLTWLLFKRHLKSCLQPLCARCSQAPLALAVGKGLGWAALGALLFHESARTSVIVISVNDVTFLTCFPRFLH